MNASPIEVLLILAFFLMLLSLPALIKKRARRWFFGGRIEKTFNRKIKSNRRFYVSDVDIHVIRNRRHPLIGIELQQRTAVGKHPILMTFTVPEAAELQQALADAVGFAKAEEPAQNCIR